MKVYLRDTESGSYYQEPSKWTPRQEAAHDFKQSARAVEWVFEAHLEHVEILLCYDDPRYDLILAVPRTSAGDAAGDRASARREQPQRDESHAGRSGKHKSAM
jgi:hypothetical protein